MPAPTRDVQPPGIFGHNRAKVARNYAVLPPAGILDSRLPGFGKTIVRFLAAPAMGARFAQILLEIQPGGGTARPVDDGLEHFLYVIGGEIDLSLDGTVRRLPVGGYAYAPPGTGWGIAAGDAAARVLWIKRPYERIDLPLPGALIGARQDLPRINKHTEGRYWQYLLPLGDMAFDMEINILGFAPGNYFPCVETHIMEHGLYMLEGQGLYLLENDWHECWTGDFIWMGPYCPQQFYCTGWEESAYLLYKDVNRDVRFD